MITLNHTCDESPQISALVKADSRTPSPQLTTQVSAEAQHELDGSTESADAATSSAVLRPAGDTPESNGTARPKTSKRDEALAHITQDNIDRYFHFVDVLGPDDCWPYNGPINRDEYGIFYFGGLSVLAHRFSYTVHRGPIPKGLQVRHWKCAVRRCQNPKHLVPGTPRQNTDDQIAQGRIWRGDNSPSRQHPESIRRGEAHPLAKLSDAQVRKILEIYLEIHVSVSEIATRFGVCEATITALVNNRTRKNLERQPVELIQQVTRARWERNARIRRKIPDSGLEDLMRLWNSGETKKRIAASLNCSQGAVHNALARAGKSGFKSTRLRRTKATDTQWQKVLEKLINNGINITGAAAELGVSENQVRTVLRGESRKRLPSIDSEMLSAYRQSVQVAGAQKRVVFSRAEAMELLQLWKSGASIAGMAKTKGRSETAVRNALYRTQ